MADENVNTPQTADANPAQVDTTADATKNTAAETPVMGETKGETGNPATPEGEQKPDAPVMGEQPKEEPKDDKKGEDAPFEPPADYFEGVTLPEGVVLDKELAPKAQEVFGKYKLPKEAAQEFVDLTVEMRKKEAAAQAQHQAETVRKMADELRSRPKFKEELPIVRLGIDNLAKDNPKIRELYNDPVFGNMPELWDIAYAVGRRFETEGHLLSGGADSGQPRSFLDGLYPSMNNKKE